MHLYDSSADWVADRFTICSDCVASDRTAPQFPGCFATGLRNSIDLICDRPHGSLGFSALVDTLCLWAALYRCLSSSATQAPAKAAV
ncbi:MAG: hypothetical protein KME40_05575 [Komarekiella atlantica HA4396-MV6]|nr:hypothetical protein [Komarekiella atlantica HA4396-MV6]